MISKKGRFPRFGKHPVLKDRHKTMLSLIFKRWAPLGLAMICMAVMAAATSATAYLVKPVLDDIFLAKDRTMVRVVPFLLLAVYLVRGLAYFGQEYLMFRVGRSVLMDLRNMLFCRILDFPLSFFHKEKTGGLISRVQYDVGLVKSMSAAAATGVLRDSFAILGLVGVLFYMDWIMAFFAMVALPLGFYVIYLFGGKVRRVATICQVAMADLHSFLHETFVGAKIVKAFGAETRENEVFSKKTTGLFRAEMKSIRAQSISSPVVQAVAGAGIAFIVWYGGNKVLRGESTPGAFFSFIAALVMLYDPVRKLSRLNNSIQQGLAALDRVFDAYEQKSEIQDSEDAKEIGDGPCRVVFDGVWFRYGNETPMLKNIDLAVEPGEVVALSGSSGAGKTSLVNLVPRFYDVCNGSVRVGGKDTTSSCSGRKSNRTRKPSLSAETGNKFARGDCEKKHRRSHGKLQGMGRTGNPDFGGDAWIAAFGVRHDSGRARRKPDIRNRRRRGAAGGTGGFRRTVRFFVADSPDASFPMSETRHRQYPFVHRRLDSRSCGKDGESAADHQDPPCQHAHRLSLQLQVSVRRDPDHIRSHPFALGAKGNRPSQNRRSADRHRYEKVRSQVRRPGKDSQ